MTFGQAVAAQRKKLGFNQKEFALILRTVHGMSMSATYLNDIEHDRRRPTSDEFFEKFGGALDVWPDYLRFIAGIVPHEMRDVAVTEENFGAALEAFRLALKK